MSMQGQDMLTGVLAGAATGVGSVMAITVSPWWAALAAVGLVMCGLLIGVAVMSRD